jgi:anti-anti-sigma factor
VGAGSSAVVVDCAHLRFCDSAGLHAFVSIRGTAGVDSLTLVRTTPTVRRLLALAGLDDLLGATP